MTAMDYTSEAERKPAITGDSSNISVHVVNDAEAAGWDHKATCKLLWKLDWNIIPFMSLIYLLCFLDRTNIGNARLDNLEQDLGLKGLQYNNALAILFPFYIAAEIPSNIMMSKISPRIWLTFIMVCWSVCMMGQGFVTNYAGLLVTRALIGLSEGGLFPGVNYYITRFYRREECGIRMATFFSAATLAGAFGGILARGIAEMDGVGGLEAWAWIFVLEGLLSVIVSALAYGAIRDYPDSSSSSSSSSGAAPRTTKTYFLSEPERHEVLRRLRDGVGGQLSNETQLQYVFQALRDWKIWVHMGIFIACFGPIYSFSLFSPTIVKGMGYTANAAQLMSVPPYVCACVATVTASYFADRVQQRGVFLLAFQVVAIAGFALLAATDSTSAQYGGLVLAAVGIYPQVPLSMAWNSGNIGGSMKRGAGIAMQVMGGNCGGIVASYVYLAKDGPRYIQGHAILIGFVSMAFVLTTFMTIWCRLENARRDRICGDNPNPELTEEQKLRERELGDHAPSFRYSI